VPYPHAPPPTGCCLRSRRVAPPTDLSHVPYAAPVIRRPRPHPATRAVACGLPVAVDRSELAIAQHGSACWPTTSDARGGRTWWRKGSELGAANPRRYSLTSNWVVGISLHLDCIRFIFCSADFGGGGGGVTQKKMHLVGQELQTEGWVQ
jgi:hypothetical protein